MVAYSFKKQFVPHILAGQKEQTIRADRKRHARPAEPMQLYTGMRTKQCRLIGTATCFSVHTVTIDLPDNSVIIGGDKRQGWADLDRLAHQDGFDGWLAMRSFWLENHPEKPVFSGLLIRWTDFHPGAGYGEIM